MDEAEARTRAEKIVDDLTEQGVEFESREEAVARYMRFLMDESAG
jgi:hypothetical protein